MQKAPVMKGSGLAPIEDEPVHVFGRNLEARVIESKQEEEEQGSTEESKEKEDDVETIKQRKFETITGEEDEETAFQGDFKLFIWDKSSSNWTEKGRGQLKLNDMVDVDEHRSRLIMRAGGTYRIILNVAIQHPFFKIIANTKTSIRFTDSQSVWAASGSNAKQLGDLIADRLKDMPDLSVSKDTSAAEPEGTSPNESKEASPTDSEEPPKAEVIEPSQTKSEETSPAEPEKTSPCKPDSPAQAEDGKQTGTKHSLEEDEEEADNDGKDEEEEEKDVVEKDDDTGESKEEGETKRIKLSSS